MTDTDNIEITFVPLATHPTREALTSWWNDTSGRPLLSMVDQRELWIDERASLPADVLELLPSEPEWAWAIYPWLNTAVVVPNEATLYAVLTSRNYPIITRTEQALLADAHLVLAGLSTGRAVAQQVARLGVGSFHLVDGDHLAPSNTNRLVGTRLTDMGVAKVVSTARELLEFNPYLRVTTQTAFLDEETLDAHLTQHSGTAVIEMIDGFPAKVAIRRAARRHGLPVIMPTDMDWDPMVDVDHPDEPMFGGRLNDADLAAIEDPTTGFADKTAIAMRFMALKQWAPRSFLSGQLARNGLVKYWSQTAPSAAVGGAMVARAVLDVVRGQRSSTQRAIVSIREAFGTSDPIDESETLYQDLITVTGPMEPPR